MPAIVAPLSRILAVADVARSTAFYRDVLGFQIRQMGERSTAPPGTEAVSGPARLAIVAGASAADSTGVPRPRGSAILFFQVDDVAAMRNAIVTHGGSPGNLERVNWIKMEMFQIQDPDGHTLWFGQSFAEPDSVGEAPRQLLKALPELPLSDVPAGIAHYRDVLGFHINYAQADLGVMDRDDVTVLLLRRGERHSGIGSCYVYVRDADALHQELTARGARVQGDPVSRPWGLREFQVLDAEGNRITFGQPFE